MSSRAIKPKRDFGAERSQWHAMEERAPSVLREEGPTFARYLAVASLMCITLGGAAVLFHAWQWRYLIPPVPGYLLLALGIFGLQYHAFVENDFQFRRMYGAIGFLLFVAAVFLRFVPVSRGASMGQSFLPYGAIGLFLSLGFLLSFIKNETELTLRNYATAIVGLAAVANALAGLIGIGFLSARTAETFLVPSGVLHLAFGLLFAVGYVGSEGISTARGFMAGRAIGIFGLTMFVVGLLRSLAPAIWQWLRLSGQPPTPYFLPSGLVLMYLALEYLAVYLGVCSDNKLVVLTRRELASFFSSPIIYIVMIGMTLVGWLNFINFIGQVEAASSGRGGGFVPEPIFAIFMLSFLFIIPLIFLVPIITMRMMSEEKRSGTLEMLLTAPVNERQIVWAKFLAGVRVFLLCWYIWGLFFIGMWVEGGPFDYRPMVTFWLALCCLAANFIAMGLFFSTVTRHQILAAVMTFVVMMVLTLIFFLAQAQFIREAAWLEFLLRYVSYIDIWISSTSSTITPRLLVLNLSVAGLWLFLTIKVLEARKWT